MFSIIKMDNEQEIKNLINSTKNEIVKKQLELMLTNIIRLNTVLTCDICGSSYKYHSKSKHLKTKKHIESEKSGSRYKALTADFCKRKEELDKETYEKKKLYYKERYRINKEKSKSTINICEKTT